MRINRAFYILFILGLMNIHSISFAQDAPPIPYAAKPDAPEGEQSGKMHTRKLHSEETKEEPKREKRDDAKIEDGADTVDIKKSEDPEEEIWRKYKKISGSAKSEKAENTENTAEQRKEKTFAHNVKKRTLDEESALDEKKDQTEIENSEQTAPPAEEEQEKSGTGISDILEGYVNRSTHAPRMGTRSFHNPEDRVKKKEAETDTEAKPEQESKEKDNQKDGNE